MSRNAEYVECCFSSRNWTRTRERPKYLVRAVGDANSTVPETFRHPIRSDDRPESNISIAVAKTGFIEIAEAAGGVLDPSSKDGSQADYVST